MFYRCFPKYEWWKQLINSTLLPSQFPSKQPKSHSFPSAFPLSGLFYVPGAHRSITPILKQGEKKGRGQFPLPSSQETAATSILQRMLRHLGCLSWKIEANRKDFYFKNSLRTIPYNTHANGSWENEAGPSSHSSSGVLLTFWMHSGLDWS